MTDTINAVTLCVDSRMLIPALFVAEGVRRYAAHGQRQFDIIIFAQREHVTDTHRQWAHSRGIAFCHEVDTSRINGLKFLQKRFPMANVMRLLVPEYLGDRYRKVLHLDADLSIHGDITPLFRLEMGDFAIAAVPGNRVTTGEPNELWDWWQSHFKSLGMTFPYRYFNAGVMLIDTANWRRQDLTARALQFIEARNCMFPNEDALNSILDGAIVELSPIWNLRPKDSFDHSTYIRPVIVHYAGPIKPWVRYGKQRRLFQCSEAYQLYKSFLRETPWSRWLSAQWSTWDFLKSLRYEVKHCVHYLWNKQKLNRTDFAAALSKYYSEAPFADIKQGIAVMESGIIKLAASTP